MTTKKQLPTKNYTRFYPPNNMIENKNRNGNFTSSEIFNLMTNDKSGKNFGKPALTYIEECNMERRLGRALTKEESAKPLSWGNLVESRAFELLGTEYKLSSQETFIHRLFPFWAGSPDGNKFDDGQTVFDEKCPITLKSFCQYVQPLYDGFEGIDAMNCVREEHKDGEKNYWQLVSNSILTDSKFAELIIYCPYKSELQIIKELAQQAGTPQYSWIYWALENELPYLIDGGYYKNVNIIRFEVPQADKELLTERVALAGKQLINPVAEIENKILEKVI